jgi:hypothetical protein
VLAVLVIDSREIVGMVLAVTRGAVPRHNRWIAGRVAAGMPCRRACCRDPML